MCLDAFVIKVGVKKRGATQVSAQILRLVHEKINEHPNIGVSQFFSRCDEVSFD